MNKKPCDLTTENRKRSFHLYKGAFFGYNKTKTAEVRYGKDSDCRR